jgi:REP element-mobilizing transposase RayT
MKLLEIGADKDHVHFLVQSAPTYDVRRVVTLVKGLMAKEVLVRCPQVKKALWGGEFWTDGYYASTVGQHGTEDVISRFVRGQGGNYECLHGDKQLTLF